MKSTESLRPRILIADDQAAVLEALRLLLKAEGWELEAVTSPAGVLDAVEHREFDVLLMDLNYARDTTAGADQIDRRKLRPAASPRRVAR
ncbi:MAG TPA: response regulator [Vicinamibacterales bacterium]